MVGLSLRLVQLRLYIFSARSPRPPRGDVLARTMARRSPLRHVCPRRTVLWKLRNLSTCFLVDRVIDIVLTVLAQLAREALGVTVEQPQRHAVGPTETVLSIKVAVLYTQCMCVQVNALEAHTQCPTGSCRVHTS